MIKSAEPQQISEEKINDTLAAWGMPELGTYMFAGNSRAKAERAKKELGWEPKAPALWDTVEADIDDALSEA